MLGSIGFPEIVMIFLVVMLLFGPKKMPEIAKLLGTAIREFKKTVNDAKESIREEIDNAEVTEDLINLKNDLKEISNLKNTIKENIIDGIDIPDPTKDEIEPQDIKERKGEKKK